MKAAEEYLNDSINMPGMQPLYEHGNVINMINQARIDALEESTKILWNHSDPYDMAMEFNKLIDEIK